MEKEIFEQACIRLQDPAVVTFINSLGFEPPKSLIWFEDQFEENVDDAENKSLPIDFPAIAWQFSPTKLEKGNGSIQRAEGELVLHIAQRKFVDGMEGSASLPDYKKLLDYADLIIDLFNGYAFDCSAKLFLINIEKDHLNRSLMIDKVTFSWSGIRRKRSGIPA